MERLVEHGYLHPAADLAAKNKGTAGITQLQSPYRSETVTEMTEQAECPQKTGLLSFLSLFFRVPTFYQRAAAEYPANNQPKGPQHDQHHRPDPHHTGWLVMTNECQCAWHED